MMRNLLFGGILATVMAFSAGAQEFNRIPSRWKWLSDDVEHSHTTALTPTSSRLQ